MAELHVERKDSNPWPWIIALLVVAAVALWFILGRGGDTDDNVGMVSDTTTYAAVQADDDVGDDIDSPVVTFVQFTDSVTTVPDTGLGHDYTSTGLEHLIAALDEAGDRDAASSVEVEPHLEEMRALADSLQMDAQSTEHSRHARNAFLAGASLMEQMQQGGMNLPANTVAEVRSAATEIQPSGLLLDQIPAVRRYFEQSATALRTLSGM